MKRVSAWLGALPRSSWIQHRICFSWAATIPWRWLLDSSSPTLTCTHLCKS
jgi:hypothetical protein